MVSDTIFIPLENKIGIAKYFTPDPNNPIDQDIVRKIRQCDKRNVTYIGEERICRLILSKRIGKGIGREKKKADTLIRNRIQNLCQRQNKDWNDVVRQLFCIEFGIKQ